MKYLIVLLIVLGVAVFLYRDDKTAASTTEHSWHLFHFLGIGELLVVSTHSVLLSVCD